MAKILKNTTNFDIAISTLGVNVPANSSWYVPESEYFLLSEVETISELTPYYNSGDLVLNNGTVDLNSLQAVNASKIQPEFKPSHIVYVDKNGPSSGADGSSVFPFNNLADAIAYVNLNYNLSYDEKVCIDIAAGVYIEDPLTIPSYTVIRGCGSATKLKANNVNADFINISGQCALSDLEIGGVSNTNNWLINISGNGTFDVDFHQIIFEDAVNGLIMSNVSGHIDANLKFLQSENLTGQVVQAGQNCHVLASELNIYGNTTTNGFKATGDARFDIVGGDIRSSNIGIIQAGTGTVEVTGTRLVECAIPFQKTGSGSIIFKNATAYFKDADIQNFDNIKGNFTDIIDGDDKLIVLNELSVGTPNRGREAAFGEGDSYTNSILAYTYNGVSYTDVSEEAKSPSGSTFQFPSLAINSALYISTAYDTTSPLKFHGFKISITQAAILPFLSDIIFEYWNGTSWVEVNHMITKSTAPYLSLANDKFTQTGSFHVRFSCGIDQDWAVNDPVSFGSNLYWIRMRIDGLAITQTPIFEQLKIHTNRFEVNEDGFQEMFGRGRIIEKFPITFTGLADVPGKGANSSAVYLSDNLAIDFTKNSFPSNASRSAIFTQFIPYELDTSCPLRLTISYFVDSATSGDIKFRLRWATSDPGDSFYTSSGSAPTASPNERSLTGLVPVGLLDDNKMKVFSVNLDIPEAVSQQTNGNPKTKVWISIERIGNDSEDTYSGNAIITDLALFYTAWREGGYVGGFS